MAEFNLKTALRAIGERRTKAQKLEQDELNKAGRGRLDPNSAQERITRAQQQEKDLLEQMRWLRRQPDSEVKTLRMNGMFDRLGELAAEQGDYKRAASITHDVKRRLHYRSIRDAIKRRDDANCECESDRMVDRPNGIEFESPAIMTVDQIVGKDGRLLNLDVCRKCGFKNAR